MARYHGNVGYAIDTEITPGVWDEIITEHEYSGDVIKNQMFMQQQNTMNAQVTIANSISIVGDQFAFTNAYSIRYVMYLGYKCDVTSIEILRPRIILSIGGVNRGR